jgi:hypothetical protein
MSEDGKHSASSSWVTHVKAAKAAVHFSMDNLLVAVTNYVLAIITDPSVRVRTVMEQEIDTITCFRNRFSNLSMVVVILIVVREMMMDVSADPEHRQFWSNRAAESLMAFVKTACARDVIMIDWVSIDVVRKIREILRDLDTSILLAGHGSLFNIAEAQFVFRMSDAHLKKCVSETVRGIIGTLMYSQLEVGSSPDFIFTLIPPMVMGEIKKLAADFKTFINDHWVKNKVDYCMALEATNI